MSLDNPGLGEQITRNQKRMGLSQETKNKGLLSQLQKLSVTELPELPSEDRFLEDLGENYKRMEKHSLNF